METRHKTIFTLVRDLMSGKLQVDMFCSGQWPCDPADRIDVLKAYKRLLGNDGFKETDLHKLLSAAQGMSMRKRFQPNILGPYQVESDEEEYTRETIELYVQSLTPAEFLIFHKDHAL